MSASSLAAFPPAPAQSTGRARGAGRGGKTARLSPVGGAVCLHRLQQQRLLVGTPVGREERERQVVDHAAGRSQGGGGGRHGGVEERFARSRGDRDVGIRPIPTQNSCADSPYVSMAICKRARAAVLSPVGVVGAVGAEAHADGEALEAEVHVGADRAAHAHHRADVLLRCCFRAKRSASRKQAGDPGDASAQAQQAPAAEKKA